MDPSFSPGRATLWLGAALCIAAGALAAGCGTDPVNPDGCRSIEDARCAAVAACPGYEGLDVDACKRFYRDQCLHGLSTDTDPGEPAINQCVRAMELAGHCAKAGQPSCSLGQTTGDPCTAIEHPEKYFECSFLTPPSAPTPDAAVDAAAEPAETPSDDAAGAEAPVEDGG